MQLWACHSCGAEAGGWMNWLCFHAHCLEVPPCSRRVGPGGLTALLLIQLAESAVCWAPGGWSVSCLPPALPPALTQQVHGPGVPRPACQGLPIWPGPSQAAEPCQAGAEHLHRVPHTSSAHWLWPFWVSGQQAVGTCGGCFPRALCEHPPHPNHLHIRPQLLRRTSEAVWTSSEHLPPWTSHFPSVKWSHQAGRRLCLGLFWAASDTGLRLEADVRQAVLGLSFATNLPCDPRLAAAPSGYPDTQSGALDPGRRPPCSWAAAAAAVSRQLGRPGRAPEARSGLKCAPGRPAAGGGAAWWEV